MSPVYPTLPRLTVRDSFDDEDLSDVDDEVFIRDGRNGGLKIDDEGGVKRPLMAPRRKCKITRPMDRRRMTCKVLLAPCCYGSVALLVLLGLITLVIFAVSVFPVPLNFLKSWLTQSIGHQVPKELDIAACTSLAVRTVWTRSLPKLMSESPLRSIDVNGDKIDDVIVSFSTGLNEIDTPQYVCNVYFGGQASCLAGVLALNGATGETIWTHWSSHVIFSLNCALDINGDGIKDCVGAGRGGTLYAISGRDGSPIWALSQQDPDKTATRRILDVYDANYIADIDGDEVADVLAAHTVQIGVQRSSSVILISGKTGSVIRKIPIGNNEELYLAPQILVHPDGEKISVLVTGSHKQSGGLFIAPFSELLNGKLKLQELYHDSEKGVLSQPILADITEDGTEDIVVAMFNSVIAAYNGRTFEQIWNYTVPNSEVISSPIPGYYNDDDVPDFMVKHQLGPGFPVYYYTVAMIIDGKNGKPLLEDELVDNMSGQMAGVSVTVDGYGNDWFLHWSADCLNHEKDKSAYEFLKSTSLASEMGADLCKLRFNSTLSTKFLALSQHTAPPGLPLYVSEEWKKVEYNSSVDPRKEAEEYSGTHPDYDGVNQEPRVSSITERSLRFRPNQRNRVSNSRGRNGEDIFSEQTNFYPNSNGVDKFRKNSAANYPETNVSDDFGSDEDWRDNNKWDDENKDYNMLYEEGENRNLDLDKVNGIREQRSGSIENKKVNNDTNNVKNELDPSMDYTNGQTENNNYHLPLANNRTINLDENELSYPDVSDFDFDETSSDSAKFDRINSKRETEGYENSSVRKRGQEEVVVGNLENGQRYEPFFKVDKRSDDSPLFEKSDNQSAHAEENVDETVEARSTGYKFPVNVSTVDPNDVRNTSERSDAPVKIIAEIADKHESVGGGIVTKEVKVEKAWLTRDIFNKVTESNDEDANIEKIFKRESMKNRQISRSNKIIANDKPNGFRNKSKREAVATMSGDSPASENFDGVQRQPPTGILLPSLTKSGGDSNSVDLIFSTSWLPPSDASVILLQQDLDCISRKRKESPDSRGKNKEQKDRAQTVLECLSERGVDYKRLQEGSDRENVKIPLGQMTVYRIKLECVCPEDILKGQTCRNISPQQSWPAHLGPLTNGYFKPMRKPAS